MFSISNARLTAYAAVLLLCSVLGWNTLQSQKSAPATAGAESATSTHEGNPLASIMSSSDQDASSSMPAGITPLGAQILSQAVLEYDKAAQAASSSDAGIQAVKDFGAKAAPAVSFKTYASSDIHTVPDISKERSLAYRADLRVALEPLLENKDNELELYGLYIETKDAQYLNKLRAASANYKLAIANTEKVVAPVDAAVYQAAILNSMSQFSATLDAMTANATDPFASSALLKTYLNAQDSMLGSFNLIGRYSSQKMI